MGSGLVHKDKMRVWSGDSPHINSHTCSFGEFSSGKLCC